MPTSPEAPEPAPLPRARATAGGGASEWKSYRPRHGCQCATAEDVYMDDARGTLSGAGGFSLVVGLFVGWALGVAGGLAVALLAGTISTMVTALVVGYRCSRCRDRVAADGDDERRHLRRTRIVYVSSAATCLAGALLMGTLWLRAGGAPERPPRGLTAPTEIGPPPIELPSMPAEMLRLPGGRHPAGGLPGETLGTDDVTAGDWAEPAEGLSDDTQPPSP